MMTNAGFATHHSIGNGAKGRTEGGDEDLDRGGMDGSGSDPSTNRHGSCNIVLLNHFDCVMCAASFRGSVTS